MFAFCIFYFALAFKIIHLFFFFNSIERHISNIPWIAKPFSISHFRISPSNCIKLKNIWNGLWFVVVAIAGTFFLSLFPFTTFTLIRSIGKIQNSNIMNSIHDTFVCIWFWWFHHVCKCGTWFCQWKPHNGYCKSFGFLDTFSHSFIRISYIYIWWMLMRMKVVKLNFNLNIVFRMAFDARC